MCLETLSAKQKPCGQGGPNGHPRADYSWIVSVGGMLRLGSCPNRSLRRGIAMAITLLGIIRKAELVGSDSDLWLEYDASEQRMACSRGVHICWLRIASVSALRVSILPGAECDGHVACSCWNLLSAKRRELCPADDYCERLSPMERQFGSMYKSHGYRFYWWRRVALDTAQF